MNEQKDEELRQTALKLRTENRKTIREIAEELGIASGKVAGWLKGVPATGAEEAISEKRPAQFMPLLVSKEHVAKLYALAMDEGFEDVNEWIKASLLPWYAVKRDFEWRLRMKLNPAEFSAFIQTAMTDSIELKELKLKLNMLGSQSTTPSPAPVITKTENKGDVKTL